MERARLDIVLIFGKTIFSIEKKETLPFGSDTLFNEWCGINKSNYNENCSKVWNMNDDGKSFKKIADYIEVNF